MKRRGAVLGEDESEGASAHVHRRKHRLPRFAGYLGCASGALWAAPPAPIGLVIFAHGSGSSRLSPRNAYAAHRLQERSCATLLFDLLTSSESADRRNVFDIALLSVRVAEAVAWARAEASPAHLPIGIFGASTGAAAAIVAAASCRKDVAAVVSRGGRPDLAGWALEAIEAPTLLIVGGEDRDVLELNRAAQARMRCPNKLVIVPGAGHLFEEPGALDEALNAACAWFALIWQRPPLATPRLLDRRPVMVGPGVFDPNQHQGFGGRYFHSTN